MLCFDANLLCGAVAYRNARIAAELCFDANLLCGAVVHCRQSPTACCVLMRIFSVVQYEEKRMHIELVVF